MHIEPTYEWSETTSSICLTVYLKGVAASKTHIDLTDACVKVNTGSYLLVLDMFKDINAQEAEFKIQDQEIIFELPKKAPGSWRKLKADGERSQILQRRLQSIDEMHERQRKKNSDLLEKRRLAAKARVDRKIEKETQKRDMIKRAKEKEMENKKEDICNWKTSLEQDFRSTTIEPAEFKSTNDERSNHDQDCMDHRTKNAEQSCEIKNPRISQNQKHMHRGDYARRTFLRPVEVNFTELETAVLPARENREKELSLYRKQTKNKSLRETENLRITDRHHQYLKEKADSFFKQGNYQSAVNAYTEAIEIDQRDYRCLSNRAAAHFALKEYEACSQDCTAALHILLHIVEKEEDSFADMENKEMKKLICKALCRRAAAKTKTDDLAAALEDFNSALQYDPGNETIKQNKNNLKDHIATS